MHDVVEWVPLTGRFLIRRGSDHLSLSIKEAVEAVEEEVEKKVVEHVEVLQDYYSSFVSGILYWRGATHAPIIPLSSFLFIKINLFNENGRMKGE
jgi:hypothetical protein